MTAFGLDAAHSKSQARIFGCGLFLYVNCADRRTTLGSTCTLSYTSMRVCSASVHVVSDAFCVAVIIKTKQNQWFKLYCHRFSRPVP